MKKTPFKVGDIVRVDPYYQKAFSWILVKIEDGGYTVLESTSGNGPGTRKSKTGTFPGWECYHLDETLKIKNLFEKYGEVFTD